MQKGSETIDEDLPFFDNFSKVAGTLRQSEKIKLCFIEISSKLDVSCEIGIVKIWFQSQKTEIAAQTTRPATIKFQKFKN